MALCEGSPRAGRATPPTAAERRALRLDAAIGRLATRRGALELALGTTLLDLFEGPRLMDVGFSKQTDYARARGIKPSTMYEWTRLARGLATRPLLRRAVIAGAVTPNKARAVMRAATGDDEAFWTAAAMRSTLAVLERAVRAEGKEAFDGGFETEILRLRMTPAQQDRVDEAHALARRTEGFGAAKWRLDAALAEEYLGGHGEAVPAPDERGGPGAGSVAPEPDPAWKARIKRQAKALLKMLDLLDEVDDALDGRFGEVPEERDGLGYDGRVRRLLQGWTSFDRVFGALLERVQREGVAGTLKYGSFGAYCKERLGMSPSAARQRISLERQMSRLPPLREAFEKGHLTYTQALLVGREADWSNVHRLIEEVASTTTQQAQRESDAREAKKDRAEGRRKLYGPKETMETVALAIATAQEVARRDWDRAEAERKAAWALASAGAGACGGGGGAHGDVCAHGEAGAPDAASAQADPPGPRDIDAGEAWARIADHFREVWAPAVGRARIPKSRWDILMRTGGLCAVPDCSRAAEHVHHLVYRSHCGGEEPWNKVGLCWRHHMQGVHEGRMVVTGRAGELLLWHFRSGAATSLDDWRSEWATHQADDARRRDAPGKAGPFDDPDVWEPVLAGAGADAAADAGLGAHAAARATAPEGGPDAT